MCDVIAHDHIYVILKNYCEKTKRKKFENQPALKHEKKSVNILIWSYQIHINYFQA